MTNLLWVVKTHPNISVINITNTSNYATRNIIKHNKRNPVNMAYASYESTRPVTDGTPSPLLIMHGLFGSKANWNSLCKTLHRSTLPQRKIISVDARNHGDSPHSNSHSYMDLAEDIKALLRQQRIKQAAVLGHSMGGRGMMYFALRNPNLVERLIVADISPISTSPSFKAMIKIFSAMHRVVLPKNVPMSTARINADVQLSKSINDRGLRAFVLSNMVQKSDGSYGWRINVPVLLRSFAGTILGFPRVQGLKFKGPVLFVNGGKSDYIQKADHTYILKMFPKAEFRTIEGAGHWLHNEKPLEFSRICTDFLNRTALSSLKTTVIVA